MVSSCDVNTRALFIWWWRRGGCCAGILCCVVLSLIGTNHSFVREHIKPCRIILLLYLIVHWSFSNATMHPASHSFTTDNSDCCFSCGMMYTDRAASGKDGQFISQSCVDFMNHLSFMWFHGSFRALREIGSTSVLIVCFFEKFSKLCDDEFRMLDNHISVSSGAKLNSFEMPVATSSFLKPCL